MKTQEYKNFRNYVSTATEDDPIWWAGYLWINLTEKQLITILDVLKNKDFIKETTNFRGQLGLEIPSGLHIAYFDKQ